MKNGNRNKQKQVTFPFSYWVEVTEIERKRELKIRG